MLKRVIRSIRQKPKGVRDQYALWTAVLFTAVVIVVWFVNLPDRFEGVEPVPEVVELTEEPASFTDMIGGLREEIGNLSQATTTPVATTTRPAATSTWTPASSTTRPVVNPTAAAAVRIATFTTPVASTTP